MRNLWYAIERSPNGDIQMPSLNEIAAALKGLRIPPKAEEYEIHDAVAHELENAGLPYIHEFRIRPGCRIDFMCGRVGIEIKKSKPDKRSLAAQAARYLEDEALEALIVISPFSLSLPSRINRKPVLTIATNPLWGVALP